jgi:hypothetical protein
VAQHGGLREVADLLKGVFPIGADAESILAAARALREPARWDDLVASIPAADETGMSSWIESHRQIYSLAEANRPIGRKRSATGGVSN